MELVQQLDEAAECVRVVATARPGGAKALIGALKARFAKPYVRTQRLPKQVFYERLLGTCVRERIGYDNEGIKAVERVAKGSLRSAYQVLQHCHRTYSYVSQ